MRHSARGTLIMVALIGVTAAAMLLPAAVGFTLREHALARAFLYSASLLASIAGLIFLASRGARADDSVLSHPFYYLALAYLILPALMAIPLTEAVPGMRFLDAWFEMVAAFTTTGASVLDGQGTLALHLWRALVAWGGGLFTLVAVMALLAPMNLGGFELFSSQTLRQASLSDARTAQGSGYLDQSSGDKSLTRLRDQLALVGPVYVVLTLALWIALSIAGNPPLLSLIVAMSTLSTSGITPEPVLMGGVSEVLIALVLVFALSRRFWPGATSMAGREPLRQDMELRLALVLLAVIVLVQVLGARAGFVAGLDRLGAVLAQIWGMTFTALSFLTTTGFVSAHIVTPDGISAGPVGLVFLGLAMIGGGVATTAGGLKLMRVFALFWQARHEIERLIYPVGVGGDGPRLRGLRRVGAIAAWLFLMIFIFSLVSLTALLTLTGVHFEDAMIFAVAALTTTGPLVQVAAAEPLQWAGLGDIAKIVMGFAMVLGRLELLLLLSIFWRR